MNLLNRLKSLFGTRAAESAREQPPSASQQYKGFEITPTPINNGGMYRVAATISKGKQSHRLIRADEMADRQTCIEISLRKSRQVIDQQDDRLFQ